MGPRQARTPRDLDARTRLQRAQQAEASAVSDVYRAEGKLAKAQAKRDEVVAAAEAAVDRARADVTSGRAALVHISGRQRAALLLGLKQSDLPRAGAARASTRDD